MMRIELQPKNIILLQVADSLSVIMISRHFARFFAPFLSHKGLVFRRLWRNHGLIELRQKEKNASQDKSTTDGAGGACTQ
jgi:hypothetical protein